jgi:small-conductance mechanosensitive channel
MRTVLLTAVVTCAVLLWGCGQQRPEISDQAARTLQRDVAAMKSAADEARWQDALAALDRLEADVADAAASGNLSTDRAARIRTIRQRVLEDLDRITDSAPTPPPSATPSAEFTPSPKPKDSKTSKPDEENNPSGEEDKGSQHKVKGKGKGKGKP